MSRNVCHANNYHTSSEVTQTMANSLALFVSLCNVKSKIAFSSNNRGANGTET